MNPGKYAYSEPFIRWFAPLMRERDRINEAKAAGTYQSKELKPLEYEKAMITPKQTALLRRLGFKRPLDEITLGRASQEIDRLLEEKKGW